MKTIIRYFTHMFQVQIYAKVQSFI